MRACVTRGARNAYECLLEVALNQHQVLMRKNISPQTLPQGCEEYSVVWLRRGGCMADCGSVDRASAL
jgi:hypothetical protein